MKTSHTHNMTRNMLLLHMLQHNGVTDILGPVFVIPFCHIRWCHLKENNMFQEDSSVSKLRDIKELQEVSQSSNSRN